MERRVFAPDLIRMRESGEKIVMLTAYDYVFASLLDAAGIDVILVGDSLASVVQGRETTLPVTLEQIIYHAEMVQRGVKRALVVADLPFMSYQLGPKEALASAGRVIKETGVGAVKLEGGRTVASSVRRVVQADIPVMGHLGLTPQSFHRMGGHRVQGRSKHQAEQLREDAQRLQDAGVFALVLEGIPAELAGEITDALEIPTIGIGAGAGCSGQVLVTPDALGLTAANVPGVPKFVKQYAKLSEIITDALQSYRQEVRTEVFPAPENSYSGAVLKLSGAASRRRSS